MAYHKPDDCCVCEHPYTDHGVGSRCLPDCDCHGFRYGKMQTYRYQYAQRGIIEP